MTPMASPLRWLRLWGGACVDFLYPPICPLCYSRLEPEERTLCHRCVAAMRMDDAWRCPRCKAAGFGAAPEAGRKCRLCPPDDAAWLGALAATGYGDRSARCVHLFKYQRRRELGEAMAALMTQELPGPLVPLRERLGLIVPVPIHWKRRVWRGFNQSDLLAEALAETLGLPCRRDVLARVKHTKRQTLLPREKRAENVRGAFAVRRPDAIAGNGVLLIDDVVTTGETIGECARVLRRAGAREVWVACFARAGAGGPDAADDDWLHASQGTFLESHQAQGQPPVTGRAEGQARLAQARRPQAQSTRRLDLAFQTQAPQD